MTASEKPPALPDMPPLAGVELATTASGIGYPGRPDIMLARFAPGTQVAGVLTRNVLAAASVEWTRQRLTETDVATALLINAGNANCFNGLAGPQVVTQAAGKVAELLGGPSETVMVCSTGRIGHPISWPAMEAALQVLANNLRPETWHDAARAIMTTDRWPKAAVRTARIGDATVTLYGLTKGTSMLAPDLATTISAVFTDATIPSDVLRRALAPAAATTFNCVSVDETMSTNDSMLMFATGQGPNHQAVQSANDRHFRGFRRVLTDLLKDMALQLLLDAKKDGKVLTIAVSGARSTASARIIARSVARSMLVRRMIRSGTIQLPNGQPAASRIIAAIGAATQPVARDRLSVRLGSVPVAEAGNIVAGHIDPARPLISANAVTLSIDVGVGRGRATVWTSLVAGET